MGDERQAAPILTIGPTQEAIVAARDAVVTIVQATSMQPPKVAQAALAAWARVTEVKNIHFSDSNFYGADALAGKSDD